MFPFIAAIAQAGGVFIDKIILTRRQVAVRIYLPILFIFLFLTTAILYPSFGVISQNFFSLKYVLFYIAMLISAVSWNIFYYRGIQTEKVHNLELIMMFQPLVTIFLATMLLKGERNIHIEIAAVLASLTLIFAHIEKKHLEFSKGAVSLLFAVLFISIELVLIKILLEVFSPVALYFTRTGILTIFYIIFFHPHLKKVARQNYLLIFATATLGTTQMVSKFYGFEAFGVVYTSLILIIAPILVFIISKLFLNECIKPRVIISGLIILGCIVYATLMGR